MKFSVAHPNPGKRSTENFTKISRQISRHLWQRKREKIFTSALLQGSCPEAVGHGSSLLKRLSEKLRAIHSPLGLFSSRLASPVLNLVRTEEIVTKLPVWTILVQHTFRQYLGHSLDSVGAWRCPKHLPSNPPALDRISGPM